MEGELTSDPKKQADLFGQYYQDLYKFEAVDEADIWILLEEPYMPVLSEEHRELLDQPINIDEIVEAINNLKSNTAPGPNGLTLEFYKNLSELWSPLL